LPLLKEAMKLSDEITGEENSQQKDSSAKLSPLTADALTGNKTRELINELKEKLKEGRQIAIKDEISFLLNTEHSSIDELRNHFSNSMKFTIYKNLATIFTSKLVQLQESSAVGKQVKFAVRLKSILIFLQFPTLVLFFYWKFKQFKFDRLFVVNGGYPGGINTLAAVVAWKLQHRDGAILSFHNYAVKPIGIRKIVEFPIDFLMARSIGHLVSVSSDCLNSIATRPFLKNFRRTSVIYNGINEPSRKSKKNDESEIKCLMIGSFESRKGHSFLLESFKIVLKSE
jgi:hypothetical protein